MSRRNFFRTQQAEFDRVQFDQPEWQLPDWKDQKARHIQLHIAKAAGKLIDGNESIIQSEVCPDLAIYRTQLINTFEIGRSFVGPEIEPAGNDQWIVRTARASALLAQYLEPAEHHPVDGAIRTSKVFHAIGDLWAVHEGIAVAYRIDPETAHQDRMALILSGKK